MNRWHEKGLLVWQQDLIDEINGWIAYEEPETGGVSQNGIIIIKALSSHGNERMIQIPGENLPVLANFFNTLMEEWKENVPDFSVGKAEPSHSDNGEEWSKGLFNAPVGV